MANSSAARSCAALLLLVFCAALAVSATNSPDQCDGPDALVPKTRSFNIFEQLQSVGHEGEVTSRATSGCRIRISSATGVTATAFRTKACKLFINDQAKYFAVQSGGSVSPTSTCFQVATLTTDQPDSSYSNGIKTVSRDTVNNFCEHNAKRQRGICHHLGKEPDFKMFGGAKAEYFCNDPQPTV